MIYQQMMRGAGYSLDRAYLGMVSQAYDYLTVFDISDPTNMTPVFEIGGGSLVVYGADYAPDDGVLYVGVDADGLGSEQLRSYDVHDFDGTTPTLLDSIAVTYDPRTVVVLDDGELITDPSSGECAAIDRSDPSSLVLLNEATNTGGDTAQFLFIPSIQHSFITSNATDRMYMFDLTDAATLSETDNYFLGGVAGGQPSVDLTREIVFAPMRGAGDIEYADISDPTNLPIATLFTNARRFNATAHDDARQILFTGSYSNSTSAGATTVIEAWDTSSLGSASVLGDITIFLTFIHSFYLDTDRDVLFLAGYYQPDDGPKLQAYDVSDVTSITLLGETDVSDTSIVEYPQFSSRALIPMIPA